MDNYLIIDTETFGLSPNTFISFVHEENWPPIRQIAWQIYDSNSQLIKEENFIIPEETLDLKSKEIEYLKHLTAGIKKYNPILVGHNIEFDKKVIGADLKRRGLYNFLVDLTSICTMQGTIFYCDLPNYKFPTLQELYIKLFNKEFSGAHQAINDVKATADCFLELKKNGFEFLPEKDSISNYPDYETYIKELRNNFKYQNSRIHALLEVLRLFRSLPSNLNASEELKFLENNFYNHKISSSFDDNNLSENQIKFFKYQESQIIEFFDLKETVDKFNEDAQKRNIKPLLGTSLWLKSKFHEPKTKEDFIPISKAYLELIIIYRYWLNSIKTNPSSKPDKKDTEGIILLEDIQQKVKKGNVDYVNVLKVLSVIFNQYYRGKENINFFLNMLEIIFADAKPNLDEFHNILYVKFIGDISEFIPNNNKPQLDRIVANLNKKEGCFIATLCYGSYHCDEVVAFRKYRDTILASNLFGQLFIKTYYFASPIAIKWIKGNTNVINFIRKNVLDPIKRRIEKKLKN
jgi:DNA polymerase III epsilon subunit-like protein